MACAPIGLAHTFGIHKTSALKKRDVIKRLAFHCCSGHYYINLRDVSAHDFRATASTFLYERGYEEDWIDLQLAHADENKTKASYNHAKHLENRRKMLQDWADIVDSWKD